MHNKDRCFSMVSPCSEIFSPILEHHGSLLKLECHWTHIVKVAYFRWKFKLVQLNLTLHFTLLYMTEQKIRPVCATVAHAASEELTIALSIENNDLALYVIQLACMAWMQCNNPQTQSYHSSIDTEMINQSSEGAEAKTNSLCYSHILINQLAEGVFNQHMVIMLSC